MAQYQDLAQRLLRGMSGLKVQFKRTKNIGSMVAPAITVIHDFEITIYEKSPSYGDISSGLASASDVMILVSGKDFGDVEPIENDTVGKYSISKIISIKEAGGVVALYKLVCKKR